MDNASTTAQQPSLKRIAGFALDRIWMYLVFYSIVPFAGFADVRYSLYLCLSTSLCAMTLTLAALALFVRSHEVIATHKHFPVSGAVLMSLGTAFILGAALLQEGTMSQLAVVAGGVITGIGSGVLLVCWLEVLSLGGRKTMLVELALGCCLALVVGLGLLFLPGVVGDAVVVAAPIGSLAALLQCTDGIGYPEERTGPDKWSRPTVVLFAKALVGAFAFGALAGFFDVLAGFRAVQGGDTYGVLLFAFGFAAMLAIALISAFSPENAPSHVYRLAMVLMSAGVLMTLFMGDSSAYAGGLIFAGYEAFNALVAICCLQAARSFDLPLARVFGAGLATLYLGEVAGSFAVYVAGDSIVMLGATVITLVAMMWLFLSHLYLFTEIDLIDITLGEQGKTPSQEHATSDAAPSSEPAPVGNDLVCRAIVERYGLSPRESDVLELLAQGRTNARIQEALFISAGTVSTHVRHIYQKTGSRNRQELLDLAESVREELQARGAGGA